MMDTQLLFIVGAQKTGTSTILGMLNTCKSVYLEYELYSNIKYREKFLAVRPQLSYLFDINGRRSFYKNMMKCLPTFTKEKFKYFGGKCPTTNLNDILELRKNKVIYTFRDIRTWLAKESVYEIYPDMPIKELAYNYFECFIGSFKLSNCIRIQLNEIINDEKRVRIRLANYLKLDELLTKDKWWKEIGKWSPKSLKYPSGWWSGHRSSMAHDKKCDITVELKEHKFWDLVLPIYDKYANYAVNDIQPSENEIAIDLELIKRVREIDVCFKDLYLDVKYEALFKRRKEIAMEKALAKIKKIEERKTLLKGK